MAPGRPFAWGLITNLVGLGVTLHGTRPRLAATARRSPAGGARGLDMPPSPRDAFSMPASSSRVRAILELVSELDEAERDELRDEIDIAETLSPTEWEHAWDGELSN
jgi:hypothetical protein